MRRFFRIASHTPQLAFPQMPEVSSGPQQLRAKADFVVALVRERLNAELTFDQAGVEWLDGKINRIRDYFPVDQRAELADRLACFVGECIIRTFGGAWTEKDGWWGVQVTETVWACPLANIKNRFDSGTSNSVTNFFRRIPGLDQRAFEDQGSKF